MTRWLLTPLDGSPLSEAALPWAAALARKQGCTLVLAQAVPWPAMVADGFAGGYVTPQFYDEIMATERAAAHSYLEELRAGLAADDLPVQTIVRDGAPSTVVLDVADELGVDAIVMATRGRGGLARAVLGSVAEYIVQHVTVPVLLVRTEGTPERAPSFDRLLIPLDGSALAERALGVAGGLAGKDSSLTLLGVSGPDQVHARGEEPVATGSAAEITAYLKRTTQALPARLRGPVDVRQGTPGEQILAAARDHKADVIVMATHGRTGPARWWLGSVADHVVRHADRPVLLVSVRAIVAHVSGSHTVGDVMTRDPGWARRDEPIAVTLRKLLRRRVGGVPVVDADGKLVGAVSERELVGWHARTRAALMRDIHDPSEYARRLRTETVASIMETDVPTLDRQAPLGEAIHLFEKEGVSRIPVMSQGRLVGIITWSDILRLMASTLQDNRLDEAPTDGRTAEHERAGARGRSETTENPSD
ncbi:MAG: universal stress protein [Chloroflexi bacterium]|nr:universal stress protein [Chloroflexota bacterium]